MREPAEVKDVATRERRYRRLLRAYPPDYRRERGEEMLTTLVDAAGARDRAPVGEDVALVLRGLRLRLVAGTSSARVMAVLAAVIVGMLGAVGGALAGWQTAADLPDHAEAARIAETALPGAELEESHDVLFGWAGYVDPSMLYLGGDDYAAGFHQFGLEHDGDGTAQVRQAHRDLTAAGWDVEPIGAQGISNSFTATRDGVRVSVGTAGDAEGIGGTSLLVERAQPMAVPVLTMAGLALGALVGWMLIVWLEQLTTHWGGIRKSIFARPLAAAGLLLGLPTLFNLYTLALSLVDYPKPTPIWIGYIWGPTGLLTLMAGVALAHGLWKVLAAMLRRPRPERVPVSRDRVIG